MDEFEYLGQTFVNTGHGRSKDNRNAAMGNVSQGLYIQLLDVKNGCAKNFESFGGGARGWTTSVTVGGWGLASALRNPEFVGV